MGLSKRFEVERESRKVNDTWGNNNTSLSILQANHNLAKS